MFDKFKSMALEGFIKNKFPQYIQDGNLSVNLNTSAATCVFKAVLAGESESTTVNVGKFEVVAAGDEKFLRITDVSSDRKWLDALLKDRLKGHDIKLPSFMADAL